MYHVDIIKVRHNHQKIIVQSPANKYRYWRGKSQPSIKGSKGGGGYGNPLPHFSYQIVDPSSVLHAIFALVNLIFFVMVYKLATVL